MHKIQVVNQKIQNLKRFVPRFSQNSVSKVVTQCLSSRSLIRIAGATAADYLQGLITNDMKHVTEGAPSMYAMFLNTKGRVLYDSIIYKTDDDDVFLIECDTAVAKDLELHLKKFKVRRKLDIAASQDLRIYNVNTLNMVNNVLENNEISVDDDSNKFLAEKLQNLKIAQDPRIPMLGLRVLLPNNTTILNELQRNGLDGRKADYYRSLRLKLGVGEGIEELPIGNCNPLEANCDYMHGVSFHKGCYIGQELTARTYHTGVIRKRYMPLVFEDNAAGLECDALITSNGKSVGKVKAVQNDIGLGLLRIDDVLKSDKLLVGDVPCKSYRPFWWPAQAPKERPA